MVYVIAPLAVAARSRADTRPSSESGRVAGIPGTRGAAVGFKTVDSVTHCVSGYAAISTLAAPSGSSASASNCQRPAPPPGPTVAVGAVPDSTCSPARRGKEANAGDENEYSATARPGTPPIRYSGETNWMRSSPGGTEIE